MNIPFNFGSMKTEGKFFLGLGSNLGDRKLNITQAISAIEKKAGKVLKCSSLYVSEPQGFSADTDFFNMVLELNSSLNPEELLTVLKQIESDLGRVQSTAGIYESRTIDIDILDFDGRVLYLDRLSLPHKHLHERSFVLLPLAEIAPGWVHPVSGISIAELITNLNPLEMALKMADTDD